MQIYRQAGVRGAAECNHWSVQATSQLLHSESTGTVPVVEGGGHCTAGEGGSPEEGGGRQDGEADERGAEGPVDGVAAGTWLGEEGKVPRFLGEGGGFH